VTPKKAGLAAAGIATTSILVETYAQLLRASATAAKFPRRLAEGLDMGAGNPAKSTSEDQHTPSGERGGPPGFTAAPRGRLNLFGDSRPMLYDFMRLIGLVHLTIAVWAWLSVFVPLLRGTLKWKGGMPLGIVSAAGFGVMFGALGVAFLFEGWLIPREELPWLMMLFLAGWLTAQGIGIRLDRKAFLGEPRP
jgi:hypothetical protein